MMQQTGCDGVMIARAAQGDPWIFSRILHYMKTGELLEGPSKEEAIGIMLRHARMQLEHKGEYWGIREMRKHISWYTAGFPHSAKLRREINEIETYQELEDLLSNL